MKLQGFSPATSLKRYSNTGVLSCEYCENFENTYSEVHLGTVAFYSLLEVDYFAIYYTHSALIQFTLYTYIYTEDKQLCTFLLVIAPWQEISKTAMKWKSTISDRNNDCFYTNLLKEVFLTDFKKASEAYLQYPLLCAIFRKIFFEIFRIRNIS